MHRPNTQVQSKSKAQTPANRPGSDEKDLDLPDWLNETPDVDYELSAWSEHFANGDVQRVAVSREDYKTLKDVVASLRGIYGPSERKQVLDYLRKRFEESKTEVA